MRPEVVIHADKKATVLSVRGATVANLFSSGAVKYFVRIIRVAKQTLIQAVVPSADKFVTQGDVHEEIDVLCNFNVEDLEISAPFARLRTQTLLSWARPWLVRVFQTRRTLPPSATLLEGAETAVSLFAH